MFSLKDVGCYADGCTGHQHVRNTLAQLVEDTAPRRDAREIEPLVQSLRADVWPDDMSDENDAIEYLHKFTDARCVWELVDGELFLNKSDWETE